MAKLAILSPFDQIARPLEGARTQNCDRSISYGIWGHISRPLFYLAFSGKLSIFWQTKRFKIKPSSVWFSRNKFGFAAKTFFGEDRYPKYWPK